MQANNLKRSQNAPASVSWNSERVIEQDVPGIERENDSLQRAVCACPCVAQESALVACDEPEMPPFHPFLTKSGFRRQVFVVHGLKVGLLKGADLKRDAWHDLGQGIREKARKLKVVYTPVGQSAQIGNNRTPCRPPSVPADEVLPVGKQLGKPG
jgi:hypothetical protein